VLFLAFVLSGALHSPVRAQSGPAAAGAQLTISGDATKPLTLFAADLAALPRKTIAVMNTHDNKQETYEGVLLSELLGRAGVAQGGKLKGAAMATYVVAAGSDGYRVVFSLAELDTDFLDSQVLIADKLDGQPLPTNVGPLRLVAPHDKRPGRWVRMLHSITVSEAPK
jgi:DMSO/TMAO reductase YedYZ molybdopterin-dependent catalytic subunit